MAKSPTFKFPLFAPDRTEPGEDFSTVIQNVVPLVDGYGPFPNFVGFTQALPGVCRGYFYARNPDSTVTIFAATATNLYKLNATDFSWTLVSAGGTPYTAIPTFSNWQFLQFESTVIAVQINAAPQKFLLGVDTAFSALGGSPPQAGSITAINGFIILSEISGFVNRIQWCDLFNITQWTAGVGYADFQDLPDGGAVHGLSGGDNYGLVFQDLCIRSVIYAPGQAVVFDIVRIAQNDPLFAKYSIINTGEKTFYISAQGFKRIDPGGYPVQIGKGRVDDFFAKDVDQSALTLCLGSADPAGTRVYWAYKSIAGSTGLFDKILIYDWSIGPLGEWSLAFMSGEYIASLSRPGLTLDSLDAIAPTPLPITGAANNGSGNVRLTLAGGLFNSSYTVNGQNFIEVYGVGGTTEANSAIPNTANGNWLFQSGTGNPSAGHFTIVDSTHIDLGVAFVHAYTSGGFIGGSLDALGISLDSFQLSAVATISAVDENNIIGFFTGTSMDAILETEEFDMHGNNIFCDTIRPITDNPNGLVSVVTRQNPQTARIISNASTIDSNGLAGIIVEGRYMRGRLELPAGTAWTYALGLQPSFSEGGEV